ncbi:MAG TPA: hypothetical protein VKA84_29810, partial [Gemmatimonadaceae bacterium]|nr:hypothetical protein [Gemmatimonadaceae bacterium]
GGETPHALSYDDVRETIRWYPAGDPPPTGTFVPWRFERTREGELGMDADLFGSRAGVELTWHRSLSRSLLLIDRSGYPRPIADQSGRSRTSGVEGRLFGQILERPGFRWDASLALSARSQHMLGPSIPLWSQPNFGVREQPESGYPIGALWVLPYSFADANGDGIIAYEELSLPNGIGGYVYRGPVDPTREAALQSTLRLRRGVQLSALVDHRGGMWKVNATGIQRCWYKACRAAQDPATPLDEQARAVLAMYGGGALGFVEDASFTKLREVAVAFDAPARWAAAVGAGSLRVTVAGRNLATWSSYGGPDPEVGSGGTLFPGAIDEFTQPLPRYFTARLTANW